VQELAQEGIFRARRVRIDYDEEVLGGGGVIVTFGGEVEYGVLSSFWKVILVLDIIIAEQ